MHNEHLAYLDKAVTREKHEIGIFMRFIQFSAAKLNLSLRVTKKRLDGYHDIVSLFLRLPAVESLSISKAEVRGKDDVRVSGVEIEGENIVSSALRRAREAGVDVPFLDVEEEMVDKV